MCVVKAMTPQVVAAMTLRAETATTPWDTTFVETRTTTDMTPQVVAVMTLRAETAATP